MFPIQSTETTTRKENVTSQSNGCSGTVTAWVVAFMVILTIAIIMACVIFVKRDTIAWVRMKLITLKDALTMTVTNVGQRPGQSTRLNNDAAFGMRHVAADNGETQQVPDLPEPAICTSIPLASLEEYVTQILQTETRFQREYESLPEGFTNTYDVSRDVMNKGKNRYLSYYPYDYNRVVLNTLPGDMSSSYVNASFINGFKMDMAYIAAQAPKERTVKDFWRMIWETKCCKIVMLTHLMERGKDKCEQYWSVKRPLVLGDLTVTVTRRDNRSQYIIREFTVKETKTEECRIVTQFHFVGWPDHSVPEVASLLGFIYHVRRVPASQDGPLLVHCSAGIGRTGTYITLDYHLDKIETDDEVNIYDFVCNLRKQRKGSIQTKEQYECVYSSLAEAVTVGDQSLSCQQFLERRQAAQTFNFGNCSIAELLQKMKTKRDHHDPDAEIPGRLVINGQLDHFAFMLQSHVSKYGYVVSQTPSSSNVEGFWSLIKDINSTVIVLFPGASKDMERMLPSSTNQFLEYGCLCLTYTGETSLTDKTNMLRIAVNVRVDFPAKVVHIICMSKMESLCLMSLPDLVDFVDSVQEESSENLVTVVFGEGERRYATLMCVIRNIFQGITHDNEVDIFNNISHVTHILHDEDLAEVDIAALYDIVDMKLASPGTYVNISQTASTTAINTPRHTASNTGDVYVNI